MKFMVITGNQSWGEVVCAIAKKNGFAEVLICDHKQALEKFLEFSPTHVLVGEYESDKGLKGAKSKFSPAITTYDDVISAALPGQVVYHCGFLRQTYDNYIRLPFDETTFSQVFKLP